MSVLSKRLVKNISEYLYWFSSLHISEKGVFVSKIRTNVNVIYIYLIKKLRLLLHSNMKKKVFKDNYTPHA